MLLLIEKPQGCTSFDLVKKIKRIHRNTPRVKVWHAWTLDPLATGLMIIGIWKGTKRLHALTGLDKSYEATIDFSQRSDTRDSDARKRRRVVSNDQESIEQATKRWRTQFHQHIPTHEELATFCNTLIGTKQQLLTPFSAKKQDWKKLYQYARAWTPIFKTVPMHVDQYEITSYEFPYATIRFDVWSWTYIRSLAQTIGNHFGRGGILVWLKRTRIWPYSLEQLENL